MNNRKIEDFANNLRDKLKAEVVGKAGKLGFTKSGSAEVQNYEDSIVINGQVFGKEIKQQRADLKDIISKKGYDVVIDEITYTWFNRLVALKFMSENKYLPIKVFGSTIKGNNEPDLLTKALDIDFMNIDKKQVLELKTSGEDEELYKFLILSLCNHLNKIMPFLFEKLKDYTELMFPEKLLRADSILKDINETIPEEDWKEVEIIGWLYQDYINPRKDEVFAKLKKNVKISKENIPAATQLFTPKWIVKYLVENSVGRLWLESNPNKDLQKEFKYFIDQEYEEPKEKTVSPEDVKIIDPATGSGHMLVYSFEVLQKIYKEQGYAESEIAQTILNNNLYGLEIDDRATQLAGFAVVMKAREYDKNLFEKDINLNIVGIQETPLECPIDEKRFPELSHLWKFFYNAKNYGSILNVQGYDFKKIDEEYAELFRTNTLIGHFNKELIDAIIKQAKIMSDKYDVVVTNPPYMGTKGMNKELNLFVKKEYPDTKADLFAIFIEKSLDFSKEKRYVSMITMQSWMFLSSYDSLRKKILANDKLVSMIHLGSRAFDQIGGEVVSTTAFIIKNNSENEAVPSKFIRLVDYRSSSEKEKGLFNNSNIYDLTNQKDLLNIEGSPIAYWMNDKVRGLFSNSSLSTNGDIRAGIMTGKDIIFVKYWHEVSKGNTGFNCDSYDDIESSSIKWYPLTRGGSFRKWFGNLEHVVDMQYGGKNIIDFEGNNYRLRENKYYFKQGITWTMISTTAFSVRESPKGVLFGNGGPTCFMRGSFLQSISLLNSKIVNYLLNMLNPTMNFIIEDISKLPLIDPNSEAREKIDLLTQECIDISKDEWDSRETSWDFKVNELIRHKGDSNSLEVAFKNFSAYWKEKFFKLHKNEEELNQLFIDIYDLNDELDNKVPLKDITILKDEVSERKKDSLVFSREVIVRQFLSYVVGCIFGRYNPDQEGLVLANQGESMSDFSVDTAFKPDDDNIVPVTDRDYFPDDIVGRVKEFLRNYFGANTITENLDFIASGLKGNGSSEEKIRKYFLKDFFNDHKKMYKKKPIYWLFSSGKNKGFNALIYMHRYNKELLAKMRMDYLHELQGKVEAKISIIKDEDTRSQREKEDLSRQYEEMKKYDEILNHKASEYIEIDLDDGVTVNYAKFEGLVEKI